MRKTLLLLGAVLALSACAAPQITQIQSFSGADDAPYKDILVVSLFESFDSRRYLESEIVKSLREQGVRAVASTSHMDTRTPVNRQTFIDMVEAQGCDAVLVTQLVSHDAKTKFDDARQEATYNIEATDYFNVWSVELTEYKEPQILIYEHSVVMTSRLYSARNQEPVWGIQSKTNASFDVEHNDTVKSVRKTSDSIVNHLARDGLLAP